MTKKEKQIEVFINHAEEIAREWTIAEIEGEETHPKFADQMYLVHELAKKKCRIKL